MTQQLDDGRLKPSKTTCFWREIVAAANSLRPRETKREWSSSFSLAENPKCTMTSCWMASLGFVYGLLLGNCGYQTDRKIYDQSEIAVCLRSTSTTSTPTPRFEPGPQCQLTMYQQAEIEYAEFLTSSLLAPTSFKQKAYYTLLKVIHRDVVGKRCCFLVPNWAMWAEKLDRGKTGNEK